MLKVPPNMLPETIEIKLPWTFLVAVLFTLWLFRVFSFPRSELIVHLNTEDRICLKRESCIGDTFLIAFNKRINTNIYKGN